MSAFSDSIAAPKPRRRPRQRLISSDQTLTVTRLDQLGDGCVVVAVAIVPMTSACLQDFGNAVFLACSLLLGLTWAIQQILTPQGGSRACGAELILLAAIGVVALQLIPLPTATLNALTPFSRDYLTLWGTENGRILGANNWQTPSVTPSLTRSGFVLLIAYAVFFLTLLQKLKTTEKIDRLIQLVAVTAGVMSVVGIAQRFAGNGLFLWMFEHPFRMSDWPVKAAFSNQNHFAHFVTLGIGPLIWCWHQGNLSRQSPFGGKNQQSNLKLRQGELTRNISLVAIAIVSLSVFLTNSRGGIFVFLAASLFSASVAGFNLRSLSKLVIPAILFAGLGILAYGTDGLERKWATISHAESLQELSAGRFALWAALSEAIPHFWMLGSGVGSHAEVYPVWMTDDYGVRFSHAESGYLQILLETGVAGLLLLLSTIGLCLFWAIKTFRRGQGLARQRVIILMAGLLASAAHSLVDFVWYIPGCMLLTLILIAALCRNHQLCDEKDRQPSSSQWPGVLAWLLILGMLPAGKLCAAVAIRDAESEHSWNQYRKFAIRANDDTATIVDASLKKRVNVIIGHLEDCLKSDPTDYRAASNLAAMYLQRFECHQEDAPNRMSIREIRNTVRDADFDTGREMAEWLNRAFGPPAADLYRAFTSARTAVRGQPMRGENYLVLAQVGFLAGLSDAEEEGLVAQAMRLRPHSAGVLFVAGLFLLDKGDLDAAIAKWQMAFRKDRRVRSTIIQSLLPNLTSGELLQKLQPDPAGAKMLFTQYGKEERFEDQRNVAKWYAENFERIAKDPRTDRDRTFWTTSHQLLNFAGHQRTALQCLTQASASAPHDYPLRRKLALALFEQQHYEAATRELKWCRLKMPDDTEVNAALKKLKQISAHEVNHERS